MTPELSDRPVLGGLLHFVRGHLFLTNATMQGAPYVVTGALSANHILAYAQAYSSAANNTIRCDSVHFLTKGDYRTAHVK